MSVAFFPPAVASAGEATWFPNVVEFIGDQGSVPYQPVPAFAVLAAFQAGLTKFRVVSNGTIYDIDFNAMTQARADNHNQRRLVLRVDPRIPPPAVSGAFCPSLAQLPMTITGAAVWRWAAVGRGSWEAMLPADVAALAQALSVNGGVAEFKGGTFDARHLLHRANSNGAVSPLRLDIGNPNDVLYFVEETGWTPYDRAVAAQLLMEWTRHNQQDIPIKLGPGSFSLNVFAGVQTSVSSGYTRPIAFVKSS